MYVVIVVCVFFVLGINYVVIVLFFVLEYGGFFVCFVFLVLLLFVVSVILIVRLRLVVWCG